MLAPTVVSAQPVAPLPPLLPPNFYRFVQASPHADLPGSFFLEAWRLLGPIFRVRRRDGDTDTVVAGAEANYFMQREGSASYTFAENVRRRQNEAFGIRRSVIGMSGEEHYRFRKLLKPGFSRHILNDRFPDVTRIVRDMLRGWGAGSVISLEAVMPLLVGELLCQVVMNHDESVAPYFDDIAHYSRSVTMTTVAELTPESQLQSAEFKRAEARSLQHADKILASHEGAHPHRQDDVLDDVLAATTEDPDLFNHAELRYTALGGYIGGLDSVAYTSAFMLYALLTHPAIFQRFRTEVDEAWGTEGLTPDKLKQMPILRHTLYETLRRYPVSFATKSTVHTGFDFAGHRVEAGTDLITATSVPHFDERLFRDPFTFDIDRYAAPRHEHRQPGAYAPYGVGIHLCLGAGLADVLMAITVATMIHDVEWAIHPAGYKLRIEARPTPVPKGLSLGIERFRQHPDR